MPTSRLHRPRRGARKEVRPGSCEATPARLNGLPGVGTQPPSDTIIPCRSPIQPANQPERAKLPVEGPYKSPASYTPYPGGRGVPRGRGVSSRVDLDRDPRTASRRWRSVESPGRDCEQGGRLSPKPLGFRLGDGPPARPPLAIRDSIQPLAGYCPEEPPKSRWGLGPAGGPISPRGTRDPRNGKTLRG